MDRRPSDRKVVNPTVSFPVLVEPRQDLHVEFQDHGKRQSEWRCTFSGGFMAIEDKGTIHSPSQSAAYFKLKQIYDLKEWATHSCLFLGEASFLHLQSEQRNIKLPIFLKGANKDAMRIITVVDPGNADSVCMFPFQTLEVVFTEKFGIHPEVFGGHDELERIGCGSFIHTLGQTRRLASPLCDRRVAALPVGPSMHFSSPFYPTHRQIPLVSNVEHHFFQPAKPPSMRSSPRYGYPACEIKFYSRDGKHVEDLEGVLEVRYILDGSQWDGSGALKETRARIDRSIIELGSTPHFEFPRHTRADPGATRTTGTALIPHPTADRSSQEEDRRVEAVRAWLVGGRKSMMVDPVNEDYEFHDGEDNTFVVELTQPKSLGPNDDPGWSATVNTASFARRFNPFSVEVILIDKRVELGGDTWRYMVALNKNSHYSGHLNACYIGTVRFVSKPGNAERSVSIWSRPISMLSRRGPDETDWRTSHWQYSRWNRHARIRIVEVTDGKLEAPGFSSIEFGTLLQMDTSSGKKGKGRKKKGGGEVRVSER